MLNLKINFNINIIFTVNYIVKSYLNTGFCKSSECIMHVDVNYIFLQRRLNFLLCILSMESKLENVQAIFF